MTDCKNLKLKIPGTDQYIPMIGLGTSTCKNRKELQIAVEAAMEAGYRLYDTSSSYTTEKDLGHVLLDLISQYNLKRNDIFITSKLSQQDVGSDADKAVQKSLRNLNLQYIDLYLIEWPLPKYMDPLSPENAIARSLCWKSLIKARERGWVKHLGVSNFAKVHLNGLLENCGNVLPVVNQLEWHPFWHPTEMKEVCQRNNIFIQAYNVFGGSRSDELFNNTMIINIAKKLNVTIPRLLLRWALQSGVCILPTSRTPVHIKENIDLNFEIPTNDMDVLNGFKQSSYGPHLESIK